MPLFPLPLSAIRSAAEGLRATLAHSLWSPCVTSDTWYQPCLYSSPWLHHGGCRAAGILLSQSHTPFGTQTAKG